MRYLNIFYATVKKKKKPDKRPRFEYGDGETTEIQWTRQTDSSVTDTILRIKRIVLKRCFISAAERNPFALLSKLQTDGISVVAVNGIRYKNGVPYCCKKISKKHAKYYFYRR